MQNWEISPQPPPLRILLRTCNMEKIKNYSLFLKKFYKKISRGYPYVQKDRAKSQILSQARAHVCSQPSPKSHPN